MNPYFDASALSTIVFRDDGWEQIVEWLRFSGDAGCYSDFGRGEMYSALGNSVRRSTVTEGYARAAIVQSDAYLDSWDLIEITSTDVADATEMVTHFDLALRLPDAIHVAVARRLDVALISTDVQQVRAARRLGIAAVNPLEPSETRS